LKQPKIVVFGVGNSGCNIINKMVDDGLKGVEFAALSNDEYALKRCKAKTRLLLKPKNPFAWWVHSHAIDAGRVSLTASIKKLFDGEGTISKV
jgi:hypothetical protein